MDRITKSYVEAFRVEQSLPAGDDATVFEHFVAFCVLSDAQEEDFDVLDVHTGGGGDLGLDGVAILVNGVLVDSTDVIDSLLDTNGYLDVRFIFTQAKTASGFSGEEIAAFGDGVAEFFAETPSYPHSERITELRTLMDHIFKLSHAFKHFTPICDMVFVSTGTWVDDPHLVAVKDKKLAVLRDTSLFSNVTLRVWGAAEVQASWKRSKNTVAVEFTFANKVTLPDIPGVKESYLGVLPLSEFLKVVSDEETKSIRKHIFYDNVRDFQGDNAVNGEMASSLQTGPGRDRFAVLNNGVTLIARTFRNTGNKFFAADFQIVNGCQTSHVLFNNRDVLDDTLPVRSRSSRRRTRRSSARSSRPPIGRLKFRKKTSLLSRTSRRSLRHSLRPSRRNSDCITNAVLASTTLSLVSKRCASSRSS